MCKLNVKCQIFVGALFMLALPSVAAADRDIPSSNDILQSLGYDEPSQPTNHAPSSAGKIEYRKEVMVFEEVPSSNEILQGLGVSTASRGIEMTNGIPKIATSHKVFSGGKISASSHKTGQAEGKSSTSRASSRKQKGRSVAYLAVFAKGSDVLSVNIKKYADNVANAMGEKSGLKLHISGHTDMSGGDHVNLPLSWRRAKSFQDYLIKTHNIKPARLSISGEGSSELTNTSNPYAPENRRVQIDRW